MEALDGLMQHFEQHALNFFLHTHVLEYQYNIKPRITISWNAKVRRQRVFMCILLGSAVSNVSSECSDMIFSLRAAFLATAFAPNLTETVYQACMHSDGRCCWKRCA